MGVAGRAERGLHRAGTGWVLRRGRQGLAQASACACGGVHTEFARDGVVDFDQCSLLLACGDCDLHGQALKKDVSASALRALDRPE
eukprot:scaffold1085_cov407-Prasinococcus_capsulatus_cf.AAC.29